MLDIGNYAGHMTPLLYVEAYDFYIVFIAFKCWLLDFKMVMIILHIVWWYVLIESLEVIPRLKIGPISCFFN